jgi:integrase
MRFPKRIRHRGQVLATIYGKSKAYPAYRLAWRVAGKRRMERFLTYSEVKRRADSLVKELAQGSHVTALTPRQATDALASLERLQGFFQQTGRRLSLLAAVSEYVEVSSRLISRFAARTLPEAVDGYLANAASVTRKDVAQAVEDFIKASEPLTKASDGQRAQLSAKYAYNRAIMLRRFAKAMPGHAVCDLSKDHIDVVLTSSPVADFSAKSRNHHRAALKQWLQWCVRKDYLPVTHRLLEADSMCREHANNGEIEFYTPKEFRALLETAEGPMRAMVAIGGLAGLRTAEILRLTWQDVFRVAGHIEITAGKSKTRQRRLVEVCPALAAWLDPFRQETGKVCPITAASLDVIWQQQFLKLCEAAKVSRKRNGLRHSFCSFHFALHANENLTAAQAGNSPAMVHQHYKGLATKAEAEKWFAVEPGRASNVIPLAGTATK